MNSFKEFGDITAENHCKWCGRKLRKFKSPELVTKYPGFYKPYGDYGDGAFCGLRCGYQYGRAALQLGTVLK